MPSSGGRRFWEVKSRTSVFDSAGLEVGQQSSKDGLEVFFGNAEGVGAEFSHGRPWVVDEHAASVEYDCSDFGHET